MNVRFSPLAGLTPKQESILLAIHKGKAKYNTIRASRQAGKTVLLERALLMLGLEAPNQIGAFISPSHSQSGKVYNSVLSKLPKQLVKHSVGSNSDRYIELINGTVIQFKSAMNYDLIRGNSYDFLVCDEFAFWKPDAWTTVIKQTLAAKPNSKVILASTPLGRNLFFDFCTKGEDTKQTRYSHYYFHWSDNPYYDVEEVTLAKEELPEAIYNQEYEAKFIFGNSVVFGDFSQFQTVKRWLDPVAEVQYYFGIDWSGTGKDSTVLTIMDQSGKVAYIHEVAAERLQEQASELSGYINKYKAIGYSEVNGLGQGGTEALEGIVENVFRFTTTNESKQKLVKELNRAFCDR